MQMGEIKKKRKFDFIAKKNNTMKSLNEVEYFLRNIKKMKNCINIYKIFK